MTTVLSTLQSQLPSDCFVSSQHLNQYETDHSGLILGTPTIVLCPTQSDQVQKIIQIANQFQTPLVCRGTGTGTSGGALPYPNSMVVSFERMNRIIQIDTQNRIATVEPGVITGELHRAVESQGLFYPPDPASLDQCTIGGNIAENAGGPRALKYGVTSDYVLGLKGFFADGAPFSFGGKRYKDVAGYDIKKLLVGSEGTLGVITQIQLKLLQKPACQQEIWVSFNSFDEAIRTLAELRQSGVSPSLMEFLDHRCMQAASAYLVQPFPMPMAAAAHLLIQIDGTISEVAHNSQQTITLCNRFGAVYTQAATTPESQSLFWRVRRTMSDALKQYGGEKFSHDISVPPAAISEFMNGLNQLADTHHITLLGYGHLGDGNIHVNALKHDLPNEHWEQLKSSVTQAIFQLAIQLGGTISGEHGIGITKRNYLSLMFSEPELTLMRRIKQAFDPNNILNPKKVI